MGLIEDFFSNTSETTSSLDIPAWMQNLPPELAGRYSELLGQDFPGPEEQVAPWSPTLQTGVDALARYGSTNNIGDLIQAMGEGGLFGFGAGQNALLDLLGQGAPTNMGFSAEDMARYMPEDQIESSITAALRDPYRAFTEGALPGMDLAAAATGNVGSTRIGPGGVAEGILTRGYEDRAADIAAGVRGAYEDRAFGQLSQEAQQNAMLQSMFQNLQRGVGGDLIGSGTTAANLMNMANQINLGDIQALLTAGGMETDQAQRYADAAIRQFMFPYQMLPMFTQGIMGMGETFGERTTETSEMPSPFSIGTGIGSMFMGMPGFQMPSWVPGFGGGGSSFDPTGMVPYNF